MRLPFSNILWLKFHPSKQRKQTPFERGNLTMLKFQTVLLDIVTSYLEKSVQKSPRKNVRERMCRCCRSRKTLQILSGWFRKPMQLKYLGQTAKWVHGLFVLLLQNYYQRRVQYSTKRHWGFCSSEKASRNILRFPSLLWRIFVCVSCLPNRA